MIHSGRDKAKAQQESRERRKSCLGFDLHFFCENEGRFPINQHRIKSEGFEGGDAPRGDKR